MKKALITGLAGILLTNLTLNGCGRENTEKTPSMRYKEKQEREEKMTEQGLQEKKYTLEKRTIEDTCYYIIKPKDKGYWYIAERELGDEKRWKQIEKLNKGLKSEDLKVGQKILIPCK